MQCCGRSHLVDETEHRRTAHADRKAIVTQITTLYNHGEQNKHLEIHNSGFLALLSLKKRNLRLQRAQAHLK